MRRVYGLQTLGALWKLVVTEAIAFDADQEGRGTADCLDKDEDRPNSQKRESARDRDDTEGTDKLDFSSYVSERPARTLFSLFYRNPS